MYLGLLVSASHYSHLLGSQLCCNDKTATDNFRAIHPCSERKAACVCCLQEMRVSRLIHEPPSGKYHGRVLGLLGWKRPLHGLPMNMVKTPSGMYYAHTLWPPGQECPLQGGRVRMKGCNPQLHMAVWKQVIWLHQTILSKGKPEVLAPFLWTLIVLVEDDSKEEPFSQGRKLSCFPENNFTSLEEKGMESSHPLQNSIYCIHIKPIHLNEINLSSLSL